MSAIQNKKNERNLTDAHQTEKNQYQNLNQLINIKYVNERKPKIHHDPNNNVKILQDNKIKPLNENIIDMKRSILKERNQNVEINSEYLTCDENFFDNKENVNTLNNNKKNIMFSQI